MKVKLKIKKGDSVRVTAGKDKGKTGKVLKVVPEKRRVLVEGINAYKKHVRPKREGGKGEIVGIFRSVNVSNVVLVCGGCGQPTKTVVEVSGEKKKRMCKKCKHVF